MKPAATLATFAHFEIIRTRKVARFLFEVPIEKADEALAALGGLPRSDGERWCGIALVMKPDATPAGAVVAARSGVTAGETATKSASPEADAGTDSHGGGEPTPATALTEAVAVSAPPAPRSLGGAGKQRRHFSELPRSAQAALACGNERFQEWADQHLPYLVGHNELDPVARVAEQIRQRCGVKSRADLDKDEYAAKLWDTAYARFQAETGQMAEQRA